MLLKHLGKHCLTRANRIPYVPVNGLLHEIFRKINQPVADERCSIVDEHIDPAKFVKRVISHAICHARTAQITEERSDLTSKLLGKLPASSCELGFLHVRQENVCAFLAQSTGDDKP
jgi:hypothetical protein